LLSATFAIKAVEPPTVAPQALVAASAGGQLACDEPLRQLAVCEAAGSFAEGIMSSRHLQAVTVMQHVATGALVSFAASNPGHLDVATQVQPLSLSKIFLAASWWDNLQPDSIGSPSDNAHEMVAMGSDSLGRKMALALRQAIGTERVLADLHRYGFNLDRPSYWAAVDPSWKDRLTPQPAHALNRQLSEVDWSSALSIGESEMTISALQISRFLQAIGNRGRECAPVARRLTSPAAQATCLAPTTIARAETAERLMSALQDTVKRGSATRLAGILRGSGWTVGGKTGTGGRAGAPMDQQDGWFAGLVFDSSGKARYTVATFVRGGGLGAGNAGEISVRLARYVVGLPSEADR
jgi:hypothetical protein